jgi:hypothetical protein
MKKRREGVRDTTLARNKHCLFIAYFAVAYLAPLTDGSHKPLYYLEKLARPRGVEPLTPRSVDCSSKIHSVEGSAMPKTTIIAMRRLNERALAVREDLQCRETQPRHRTTRTKS